MALTPTPVCPQAPKQSTIALSGSTYVANTITAFLTAGPNGNKIVAVLVTNSDSGAHVVQLWQIAAVPILIGSISVAANAGNDGATNNGNLFNTMIGLPIDNDGQQYFFAEPNMTLGLSSTTTLPAGKFIYGSVTNAQF